MAAIHLPRTIRIGGGVLDELPEVLAAAGLARPLIVTDGWMESSGLLERVEGLLAAAGMTVRSFTGVVPDPTVASIEQACAFLAGSGRKSTGHSPAATRILSYDKALVHCHPLKLG